MEHYEKGRNLLGNNDQFLFNVIQMQHSEL